MKSIGKVFAVILVLILAVISFALVLGKSGKGSDKSLVGAAYKGVAGFVNGAFQKVTGNSASVLMPATLGDSEVSDGFDTGTDGLLGN